MKTRTLTSLLAAILVVCLPGRAMAQQPQTGSDAYKKLIIEASRLWEAGEAAGRSSPQKAVDTLKRALAAMQQALAIADTPQLRTHMGNLNAIILWYRARVSDESGDYWTAVQLLAEARKSRPALFDDPDEQAYFRDVMERHFRSLPNRTRIVNPDDPTYILTEAISDRVFYNSPSGVKDRVLRAFQAAMIGEWIAVRTLLQEAVNLAPSDAKLQRLLALAGSQTLRASRGLQVESGTSMSGETLPMVFDIPSLKTHMMSMQNPAIMKALEDILLVFFRDAGR